MATALDLVFLWHMHQPDYRAPESGEYVLPWAYLHATKDYTDMVGHLERHPELRAVINFVPILLDQLEDYAGQIATGSLRDPLLRLLVHPAPDGLTRAEKRAALAACFRVNHARAIAPFPAYQKLYALQEIILDPGAAEPDDDALDYLSGSYFCDLATWYHLAWIGETERQANPVIAALMALGAGYSLADRQNLLATIGKLLAELVPRYRALADAGRIELSTTPHAHPIAPLLLSFSSARESQPDASLPAGGAYPGGQARLERHLSAAFGSHLARFGRAPRGVWPAEGAVSEPALACLSAAGAQWVATGEAVLANTLTAAGQTYERARDLYRPWVDPRGMRVFFRDDRLSDLIGFEYSKWHGQDAVAHFMGELAQIMAAAPADDTPLVCVVLDGENAWDYYPYNAWHFFEHLYTALAAQPSIRTRTLSTALTQHAARSVALPPVVAGSWVYGTLSTWVGEADKNRAWELLVCAKQRYDEQAADLQRDPARAARAEALLTTLEGSDWFWWLGEDNPPAAVANFETLFRHNLRALYHALELTPPTELDQPLSRGSGAPAAGGTMRRSVLD
ncbi:MAG: glycoside hydrolase [Gammaproteobacteria bacterium]|nr:glycoside hydrolase [Gammaproteobacteria bacterium]